MKLRALFAVLAMASMAIGQATDPNNPVVDTLTLRAQAPPQRVPSASLQRQGNPGPRALYYWIVASNAAGASSPAGPFHIPNAPNALSSGNGIVVSWAPVNGATFYDVLRTITRVQPSGSCACAVATGVVGTQQVDQSETLASYTVNSVDPRGQAVILRSSNAVVAGGSFTVAATNQDWTSNSLNRGTNVRYRAGGALSALKAALQDDFHEYVNIRLDGDSITWGMIATGNSPTSPRTHSLTDVRDNLTDGSWANRLRTYLCRTYLGTTTITAGGPGAGSCTAAIAVAINDSAIAVKRADGTVTTGSTAANTGATFGQFTDIAGSGGGSKNGIEFAFYGDRFTLVYSQLPTGPNYILYVDGVSQGAFTTAGVAAFKISRAHTFALGQHTIRIENQDIATQALRLEAVTWTRSIRVANDGIIGTGSNEWLSTGALLTGSVTADDEFVFVMIGTNDRGSTTVVPTTYSKTATNVAAILAWIAGQAKKAILMAPNSVTQDESAFNYREVDVQRTLARVAELTGVDFIDHYQVTQELTNLGVACQADGLHPNDTCHAQMFANIATAIERAPAIPLAAVSPNFFYVCAYGGTMTSGTLTGPWCSFTPDKNITITRIELRVRGNVAAGCSVSPLVRIYDGSTSTDTGITNAQTTNAVTLTRNENAGTSVQVLWSGGTGCTTLPSDVLTTVQYTGR